MGGGRLEKKKAKLARKAVRKKEEWDGRDDSSRSSWAVITK